MRQKTFWIVFGTLLGLVAILFVTVVVTNKDSEQITVETASTVEQAAVSMPSDITNPGQMEDHVITEKSFPEAVGDLILDHLMTGQEAAEQIKNLHMGAVEPQESYMAVYQGAEGAKADIWVSVVSSEEEAKAQLELMHEKIDGSPVFTNHQVMPLGEILYHYVEGMGQEHFFYYRGDDVIWIGVSDHQLLSSFTSVL